MKREVSRGLHRNHLTICKFAICKFGGESEADFRAVKARFNAVAVEVVGEAIPLTTSQSEEERSDETVRRRLEELPRPPIQS